VADEAACLELLRRWQPPSDGAAAGGGAAAGPTSLTASAAAAGVGVGAGAGAGAGADEDEAEGATGATGHEGEEAGAAAALVAGGGAAGGTGAAPLSAGTRASALLRRLAGPLPDSYQFVDYQQHASSSSKSAVLRTSEFSWERHGHALLTHFIPAVAPAIDRELDVVYKLTYKTFGVASDVDTEPLRKSIWMYANRLVGVFHTDFDYAYINLVFKQLRPLKAYCRLVASQPYAVRAADFLACSYSLTAAEKTHVALLCVESRKLASLLYVLRAIAAHYGSR
jgi:hypothetical protein